MEEPGLAFFSRVADKGSSGPLYCDRILKINPANGFWGTHCLYRGTLACTSSSLASILVAILQWHRHNELTSWFHSSNPWLFLALNCSVFLLLSLFHKEASDVLPIPRVGCEDVKHFGGDKSHTPPILQSLVPHPGFEALRSASHFSKSGTQSICVEWD